MEQEELVIESLAISGPEKCSFFGSKQFIYLILNYTSKANWYVTINPNQYDPNCQCYKKDLSILLRNEVEQGKKEILTRVRNKHTIDKIIDKDIQKKMYKPVVQQHEPLNLMKHKNIKIKDIDWRD